MLVTHVVGARPNFVKAAPLYKALSDCDRVRQTIVHTGQHYDEQMSDVFFRQLALPEPDVNLQVGSGTHARQTSLIMQRLDTLFGRELPDLVLIYGDVNSTVAAALVCAKRGIRIGHVEAGLRSFDRRMPEEVNRVITDQLADLLFTPSLDADDNLRREGIAPARIHFVGNVMIDTLVAMLPHACDALPPDLPSRFALVTLHRPSNVDDVPWLAAMLATLSRIGGHMDVLFPVHPRTRQALRDAKSTSEGFHNIRLLEPLPYMEFLGLQTRATMVITDSGGIQEETTFLGIPCLTVRENTERPVTIRCGTNTLVGRDLQHLEAEVARVLAHPGQTSRRPPLWDGHAAERIARIVTEDW